MIIVRSVRPEDINEITMLAKETGFGLTTLIPDKCYIKNIIDKSIESFHSEADDGRYFFVLEVDGRVVGTSAIAAKPGKETPFYTYKIVNRHQVYSPKNITNDYKFIQLVNDFDEETELCSLFLSPNYRNKVNGYLLSYVRFLYIASNLEKFTDTIFAEIRGVSNDNGRSPFWEALGRKFYCMDYAIADKLAGLGDKAFIQALKPEFPIYLNLLPKEAQAVIGAAHPNSQPAVELLKKQNFTYDEYIAIFDAGPTYTSKTQDIKIINKAQTYNIKTIEGKSDNEGKPFMIATLSSDFKASYQNVVFLDDNNISLSEKVANALNVQRGDQVIISPLFLG